MAIALTVMDLQGMFVISKVMERTSSFLPFDRLIVEAEAAKNYFQIEAEINFEELIPKMVSLNCLMVAGPQKSIAYGVWPEQKDILQVFIRQIAFSYNKKPPT